MVNFYSNFVACSNNANVSILAGKTIDYFVFFWFVCLGFNLKHVFLDHFDHIKLVIGAESIGIGADYDGVHGQVKISSTSYLFCFLPYSIDALRILQKTLSISAEFKHKHFTYQTYFTYCF